MSVLGRLFDSNEGELRRLKKVVAKINALEDQTKALSDDALRARTTEFRDRLAKGETLDDILPEAIGGPGERVVACQRRDVGDRRVEIHRPHRVANGAFLLTGRGGDFELRLGQDLSIGYLSHDADTVQLYFQESLTFLVYTTEAIVSLAAGTATA